MQIIKKKDKIFLAGHNGLLGSSILKKLKQFGYKNIITIPKKKLDLRDQLKVKKFLKTTKPKIVIIAAAKVGGIFANNKYRADFIYDNLTIQNNLIHSSYKNNVRYLIFFGSSCIYPRLAKQPIREESLLTSELEYTNEPYAIAKIAGIKMCESYNHQYKTNYKCLMPTNTYGPNDNYDLKTSHFYPALLKKIYLAQKNKKKTIEVWGTGKAKRELIYVDDIADACIFFMNKKTNHTLINIGTGKDYTITWYAKFIQKILRTNFKIKYNKNYPDGTLRKVLNISRAKKYGWRPKTTLKQGTLITYKSFIKKYEN